MRSGVWIIGALLIASNAAAKPSDPCAGMTPAACDDAAFPLDHGITRDGKHVARDEKRAAAMYQAACDAKLAEGCFDLAEMGSRAGLDEKGRIRWHRAACDLGLEVGCFALAADLKEREDEASRAEAKQIYARLCGAKNADACYALGDLSPRGAERVGWYRKACDGGSAGGCEMLAKIYFREEDPGADAAASTRALEQLCDAGTGMACDFAGQRHFEGKGARASRADADVWALKACTRGVTNLCVARGRSLLFDGDRAGAIRFLRPGCDAGDADACQWLATANAQRVK